MRVKRIELQKSDSESYEYSKGRNNQSSLQKWKTSSNTPGIYLPTILPKIDNCLHSIHNTARQGIDKLQSFVHRLLIDEQQNVNQVRKIKQLKKEFERRKQNQYLNEQKEKKMRQKLHLMRLKQKLNELKGQEKLQQKRLLLQYSLNQKANGTFNSNYDTMYNKIQNNKKDAYIQTHIQTTESKIQQVKVLEDKQLKKSQNSGLKSIDYKRKFRIAGYAVYFALAFPKYVKIFRELRKNFFIENIVKQKMLQKQIKNYLTIVSCFKLNNFMRQLQKTNKKQKEDVPSFSFAQINDQGKETQYSIKLSNISATVLFMLKIIKQTIIDGNINELLKVFSYYFIDRSFITDDIFLIDQLYRLKIHLKQRYLLLEKEQQRNLLINQLLAKITVFMFMLANRKQRQTDNKQQIRRNSKQQKEDRQLQRTMLMGGLYLFDKCNKATNNAKKDQILQYEGNIQKLDKNNLPKIMKQLQIDQQSDFQVSNQQIKRISIEQDITFSYLNNSGIKYKNMQKSQDLVKTIVQHSKIQKQIQNIIRDIGNELLKKCWIFRTQHFSYIHQSTLNHKHYLTENIQVEIFNVKRLPKQLKLIQQYLMLIKKARAEAQKNKRSSVKTLSLKSSKSKAEISMQGSLHHTQLASSLVNSNNIVKSKDIIFLKNSKKSQVQQSENRSNASGLQKHSKHRGTRSQEIYTANMKGASNNSNNSVINQNTQNIKKRKVNNFKALIQKPQLQRIQEDSENRQ